MGPNPVELITSRHLWPSGEPWVGSWWPRTPNVRVYKKRNPHSLPWLPLTSNVPDDERLEHYKKTARENPLGI